MDSAEILVLVPVLKPFMDKPLYFVLDVFLAEFLVECQLCTYLVSQADILLQQNKTDQEIVNELSRICNLFSSDIKPQVYFLDIELIF